MLPTFINQLQTDVATVYRNNLSHRNGMWVKILNKTYKKKTN